MAPTCTVCSHPDRDTVDRVIGSGCSTRDVAGRYGLSRSAVHRHATGCIRLGAPAGRLRASIDRAALAEIVSDTLDRAREALDDAEARRDRRGTRDALVTVLRAVDTAGRVLPEAEGPGQAEVVALLRTLTEDEIGSVARDAITAGLRARDAGELAEALTHYWTRRPVLVAGTKQEEGRLTDGH